MEGRIKPINHQAYERIKYKILNLELKPGQRIDVDKLCEEFQVSGTPIREGIKRLIEDGLVEVKRRKGYYVYYPTSKDIEEIYEFRKILETYALKSVMDKIHDLSPFRKLKKKIEDIKKKPPEIRKSRLIETESIHSLIIQSLHNRRVRNTYQNLYNYTFLFQHMIRLSKIDIIDLGLEEHLLLVNAILDRDIGEALKIVDKHCATSISSLQEVSLQFEESMENYSKLIL